LVEQKRIAHILGTLDDKIELNQQMNETLEAIARAIFKSWFVDFDPVKAKMSGEPYPLPDAIMALFPDELVESELGMIPKGWEYKPFGELLSFHLGGDWGKAERQGDFQHPVRIIRGTDLPDLHNGGIGEVPLRYIKESSFEKRELKDGDIIIEISGGSKGQPTGRSLYVTEKLINRFDVPIIPTSFCRLFRPKGQALSMLLNIYLRIMYDEGKTWKYQNQSTGISNFQSTYFLENEMVLVPTNNILIEFNHMIQPFILNMQTNQNITLNELREDLLGLLISERLLT
jgi:type I restriction enzyme S subunit